MGARSGPGSRGREPAPIHIELPTSICDVRHNIGSNRESRCSTFVTADCAFASESCPSIRLLDVEVALAPLVGAVAGCALCSVPGPEQTTVDPSARRLQREAAHGCTSHV